MTHAIIFQVLYSYGIGFFYILLGQIISGQLLPAFKFCLGVSTFVDKDLIKLLFLHRKRFLIEPLELLKTAHSH